jgi:hypothetical protein
MLTLAVLVDEQRASEGRGKGAVKGAMVLHRIIIGVDKFNIIYAEGATETPPGKKFVPNLTLLIPILQENNLNLEDAHAKVVASLAIIHNVDVQSLGGTTGGVKTAFSALDRRFNISKRIKTTGELELYQLMKATGKFGGDDESDSEPDAEE